MVHNLFLIDYAVQLDKQPQPSQLFQDEGFPSSQDIEISLENSDEDNLLLNYFNEQPNLHDCSFHFFCAQALTYPNQSQGLLFENL